MPRTALARWTRKLAPYAFLPFVLPRYRLRPSIRILMYHRVARLDAYDQLTVVPERFERQMALLASEFRLLSLPQAVTELVQGGPQRAGVVVTFDDGYRDNLEFALPILKKYGVPATIFVTSRFCDQHQRHPRYSEEPGRLHLNWEEVKCIARMPGMSIGSHTLTHPYLSRVDSQTAEAEIAESRATIGAGLGADVEFFCYPSGDFTARERAMVQRAGYRAAVSVGPGSNHRGTDLFALRRTEVTDRDEPEDLKLKLIGGYDPIHLLLHQRRERDFARARLATAATSSRIPR